MIWDAERMGEAKRMGEENVPDQKDVGPLQKSFWYAESWILVLENRATTPEGGGKRTRERGIQNPFLGGVSFVRFSTPLFFHPPHGVL